MPRREALARGAAGDEAQVGGGGDGGGAQERRGKEGLPVRLRREECPPSSIGKDGLPVHLQ